MIHTNRTCVNERAVSPVVGVMLMLVVTIIIAAVVSGFAGGMIGGSNKKAPTLTMDVKVVNTGTWHGSGFFATVTGVSEPIPTKDLKIVTSYNNVQTSPNAQLLRSAPSTFSGGATVIPNGSSNINVLFDPSTSIAGTTYTAPFGFGPGVNGTEGIDILMDYSAPMQQFGNYSLMQGTTLSAMPCGAFDSYNVSSAGKSATKGYGIVVSSRYKYTSCAGSCIDPAKAVLGSNWNYLEWGDTVKVKVIHIPTGQVIFSQDVPVTEQ